MAPCASKCTLTILPVEGILSTDWGEVVVGGSAVAARRSCHAVNQL